MANKTPKKPSRIPLTATITVLAKKNPHTGKKAARTFAQYRSGMEVGEWRAKVRKVRGDVGYLHGDLMRGDIRINY